MNFGKTSDSGSYRTNHISYHCELAHGKDTSGHLVNTDLTRNSGYCPYSDTVVPLIRSGTPRRKSKQYQQETGCGCISIDPPV